MDLEDGCDAQSENQSVEFYFQSPAGIQHPKHHHESTSFFFLRVFDVDHLKKNLY